MQTVISDCCEGFASGVTLGLKIVASCVVLLIAGLAAGSFVGMFTVPHIIDHGLTAIWGE